MSQFAEGTENVDVRDTNQSRRNEQEQNLTHFNRTAQNDVVGHLLHAQEINESSETSSKQSAIVLHAAQPIRCKDAEISGNKTCTQFVARSEMFHFVRRVVSFSYFLIFSRSLLSIL